MENLFNLQDKGATFSSDRRYRYCLWRIWNEDKPRVIFIGLNPSTANEHEPDPTITRVINFARDWNYGGVYMLNLFAIVSEEPKVLLTDPDPVGDNDRWLQEFSEKGFDVIFAWGTFKEARKRAPEVAKLFPHAKCLKKNKDGSPQHPLYVPGDTKPFIYDCPYCGYYKPCENCRAQII